MANEQPAQVGTGRAEMAIADSRRSVEPSDELDRP